MKRGKLKLLREIIKPSIQPSSFHIQSAASITAATLMLEMTRLKAPLSQRMKGLQVVFRQLLPLLSELILGMPAQATTAAFLCSHHASRQPDRQPAPAASVAEWQSPSLTHNSSLHEQLWQAEEGNAQFWLT